MNRTAGNMDTGILNTYSLATYDSTAIRPTPRKSNKEASPKQTSESPELKKNTTQIIKLIIIFVYPNNG